MLVLTPWGNIYVSGGFSEEGTSPLQIGSFTIPYPVNNLDPSFIVLLTRSGESICYQTLDKSGDDILSVAANDSGDVFLCGDFGASPVIIGNDTLIFGGTWETFLSALSLNA